MRKTIGLTAVATGALLMVVPRYVLPACEFEGFPAMHCSDTARAEFIVGILSVANGIAALFAQYKRIPLVSGLFALVLLVTGLFLPDRFGYCHNPHMPCNYGMVPGIRFITVTGGIIMVAAFVAAVKDLRKRETA